MIDGYIYVCIYDIWIYGQMDILIIDIWIYGYMDIWIYGYMDIWIYGQMDIWINGQMDRWIDGNFDTFKIYIQNLLYIHRKMGEKKVKISILTGVKYSMSI